MAIRITGMYSGLDTESIISELVSAQSFKKSSLVKAQTKLSWKQDAWKALNTKIYDFYTNVLSDMRWEGSYMKKTTKVSDPDALNVVTAADAVDGVRTVKIDKLAKGGYLTGADLTTDKGVKFRGGADLATLMRNNGLGSAEGLSGSFSVVGANGQSVDFNVNQGTTINDIVSMIKSTGLNAVYDEANQRIFINSANTGAVNNFTLVANDADGMKALASFGLLSKDDLSSEEYTSWAKYADRGDPTKDPDGKIAAEYQKIYDAEVKARVEAYQAASDALSKENSKLSDAIQTLKDKNTKFFADMTNDYMEEEFAKLDSSRTGGKTLAQHIEELYDYGGLYDALQGAQYAYDAAKNNNTSTEADIELAKQNLDQAQAAYDDAKAVVSDFLNDVCYGPMETVKDENGDPVQKTDKEGNPVVDDEGNPVYEMERSGGLNKAWEEANEKGNTPSDELKAQVDSLNKWFDAFTSLEENKKAITANAEKISVNTSKIAENQLYYNAADGTATDKLKDDITAQFERKIAAAQDAQDIVTNENNPLYKFASAAKVNAQDAEMTVNGAKFTSMTNTFTINGLTLTAQKETDREITISTSTDTDGIYDMIKNFFSEYNKLINEIDSLYNAESSKGYEPLTSEEKDAMSDTEIEEWEKKIKDSLLRNDSTLNSVSYAMISAMMGGVQVNGKNMYLSDFGIATLGYFKSADNERHAYHIDGDSDDSSVRNNEDKLKKMIASDPETVMSFFSKLSTSLYDSLTKKMSATELSSALTVYNDKQMKKEYDAYKDKITAQEQKLNDMMDKWYKKFSAMEVAMSKLESRSSSLTSLFGG